MRGCCQERSGHAKKERILQDAEQPVSAPLCGVGIFFRSDASGALVVSSLVPDGRISASCIKHIEHFFTENYRAGPASKTKMIIEGDILQDVDGKSVVRRPLSEVSSLMLGPKGTQSDFGFVRKGQRFVVQIARQPMPDLHELKTATEAQAPLEA
jgi:C-terminal processing protease CtpA/Prc